MTLDKRKILKELTNKAQKELKAAQEAYNSSHQHVTDEDLKSEGKYDTRSVEAGYLASAQKGRVEERQLEIQLLDEIVLDHDPQHIGVGSLVELLHNNQKRLYFISSTSGGTPLLIDGSPILVISAFSPIGEQAIGLEKGESFEVVLNNTQTREYEVISIH